MTTTRHREDFHSLRPGGLNWDSLPLRLFTKGNARFWNPADLDFSQDARDWAGLDEDERRSVSGLCAQFIAGEEAVTQDLRPFLAAMAAEGRFGDEMYLTQFTFEEAKHTQAFRLWMDAVGLHDNLNEFVADNPGYRTIFYDVLPDVLHRLHDDPEEGFAEHRSVAAVAALLRAKGAREWQISLTAEALSKALRAEAADQGM